ncbi:MAG: hypothetical protein Q9170_001627 [Blastenia crenularia]
MKASFTPSQISSPDLTDLVKDHPQHVREDLQTLSNLRYEKIPQAIAERIRGACLEKKELQSLMEWKLYVPNPFLGKPSASVSLFETRAKSGTYRASLKKLIASNDPTDVEDITALAFGTFAEETALPDLGRAPAILRQLKGVGAATASLVLACYDSANVPFFSDELFRWLHWEEGVGEEGGAGKKGKGKEVGGWDRKIKYNDKEYASLFKKTWVLRERLERESGRLFKAVEIEKAAFVLRRRDEMGLLGGSEEEGSEEEADNTNGGDEEEERAASQSRSSEKPERPAKRRKLVLPTNNELD